MAAADEFDLGDLLNHLGQLVPKDIEDWSPIALQTRPRKYLPFYMAADFTNVSSDQVRHLAVATACLNVYVVLVDHIIDEPSIAPTASKLAIQPVLLHFYRRLSDLFPPDSPIWGEVERCMNRTSRAVLDEKQIHSGVVHPFSLPEFKRIACSKMAFAHINSIALAILNNTPECIPTLTQCWDAIFFAAIVHDDVLDWRSDYENRNYTYLLSQVLLSPPFQHAVAAGQLPDAAEIGAALFCTDTIEALYIRAAEELETTAKEAIKIKYSALADLILQIQGEIKDRVNEVFIERIRNLITMQHESTLNV
jgi:hypothetical protein